jgi:hypothetical protein
MNKERFVRSMPHCFLHSRRGCLGLRQQAAAFYSTLIANPAEIEASRRCKRARALSRASLDLSRCKHAFTGYKSVRNSILPQLIENHEYAASHCFWHEK